jgi:phosphatidate phosphatase APP1
VRLSEGLGDKRKDVKHQGVIPRIRPQNLHKHGPKELPVNILVIGSRVEQRESEVGVTLECLTAVVPKTPNESRTVNSLALVSKLVEETVELIVLQV